MMRGQSPLPPPRPFLYWDLGRLWIQAAGVKGVNPKLQTQDSTIGCLKRPQELNKTMGEEGELSDDHQRGNRVPLLVCEQLVHLE